MRNHLFAGATELGLIDAKIIDESMGVIGGALRPSTAYFTDFQSFFRAHWQQPEWEQLEAFQLQAFQLQGITSTNKKLECAGGICIIDVEGFDEIPVELCGIGFKLIESLISN